MVIGIVYSLSTRRSLPGFWIFLFCLFSHVFDLTDIRVSKGCYHGSSLRRSKIFTTTTDVVFCRQFVFVSYLFFSIKN